MEIWQYIAPLGLLQEGDHRYHDEESFKAFTQQNRKSAEET
jgi:hypothetical protein